MGTLTRLPSLALCLVGVKIGRMENRGRKIGWKTVFSTVWQKKENREEEKPRRKFSLLGPQFSSSQIGRKMLEEKSALTTLLRKYPVLRKKRKKGTGVKVNK